MKSAASTTFSVDPKKQDEAEAKIAHAQGQEVRARIQHEAGQVKSRRSAEIRQAEQNRQWDRQRAEIHPSHVLDQLARLETSLSPAPALPEPVPDTELDRTYQVLPVRSFREEPQA